MGKIDVHDGTMVRTVPIQAFNGTVRIESDSDGTPRIVVPEGVTVERTTEE